MNRFLYSLNKQLLPVFVLFIIAAGISIAAFSVFSPMKLIAVAAAMLLPILLYKSPVYGLMVLIIMLPYSLTNLLQTDLVKSFNLNIFILVYGMVILIFFLFKKPFCIPNEYKLFITVYILIFAIAVIRSIPNLSIFRVVWDWDYSILSYILAEGLKNLFFFFTLILVVRYIRTEREIMSVVDGILISVSLLSIVLLIIYIFYVPDKHDFEEVRGRFEEILYLHGNSIARFYIIAFPLLQAYVLNKKKVSIAVLPLWILAAGLLYSRTAYLAIILSTLLFFIISGRKKVVPLIVALLIAGVLVMPSNITQRALMGLTSGNLNNISADRMNYIWLPVIREQFRDPLKVMLGSGRKAFVTTEALKYGIIYYPEYGILSLRSYFKGDTIARSMLGDSIYIINHAHNMYLDMMLEIGAIGLLIVMFLFFRLGKSFVQALKRINKPLSKDLMCAVIVSLVSFFISGFTDGCLFPDLTNSFLWLVIGVGISISCSNQFKSVENSEVTIDVECG
jgi:O-antigen ligase